ncbi:MAG: phage tail protein I [Sphingomonas sp.]|jgi:phage tail P2-like protein|uniref:phage tail protein I n=1 Tax=Sphingomonas TaxID=13687 RepID=UPI0003629419|nr:MULTISPECIES: phage tail protein I [Sphingomonas]MCP4027801.1 phage tail protein I [Sphingomonas sp.]
MSLLPPNATRLERALEAGSARIGDVDAPLATIADPATIAASALPWLAYGLSVDFWDSAWSEAMKRRTVAESIEQHKIKGTRASVEHVLARIDALATVIEAQDDPARLEPHTFEVDLPLVTAPGNAGGKRAQAAIVDDIIAQVTAVKPLREHLTVVQSLTLAGGVAVQGAARLAGYTRDDAALVIDASPAWEFYLQTEQGEPLQAETGTLLDTSP